MMVVDERARGEGCGLGDAPRCPHFREARRIGLAWMEPNFADIPSMAPRLTDHGVHRYLDGVRRCGFCTIPTKPEGEAR